MGGAVHVLVGELERGVQLRFLDVEAVGVLPDVEELELEADQQVVQRVARQQRLGGVAGERGLDALRDGAQESLGFGVGLPPHQPGDQVPLGGVRDGVLALDALPGVGVEGLEVARGAALVVEIPPKQGVGEDGVQVGRLGVDGPVPVRDALRAVELQRLLEYLEVVVVQVLAMLVRIDVLVECLGVALGVGLEELGVVLSHIGEASHESAQVGKGHLVQVLPYHILRAGNQRHGEVQQALHRSLSIASRGGFLPLSCRTIDSAHPLMLHDICIQENVCTDHLINCCDKLTWIRDRQNSHQSNGAYVLSRPSHRRTIADGNYRRCFPLFRGEWGGPASTELGLHQRRGRCAARRGFGGNLLGCDAARLGLRTG